MFAVFDCLEKISDTGNCLENGAKDEGCHVSQKERKMSRGPLNSSYSSLYFARNCMAEYR